MEDCDGVWVSLSSDMEVDAMSSGVEEEREKEEGEVGDSEDEEFEGVWDLEDDSSIKFGVDFATKRFFKF